jgi:DNA topoisomerase-1
MLVAGFPELFDYGFTAAMEDQLDDIANGKAERVPTLQRFWDNLQPALAHAKDTMPKVTLVKGEPQPTGGTCPECGGELVRRKGRYGYFVGCANYPKCKYIEKGQGRAQSTGETCPECGSALVRRRSRYGPFLGCSNYPTCQYTAKVNSGPNSKESATAQ